MKILYVTGSFPNMRCGVGDYTKQLALHLTKKSNVWIGVLTTKDNAISDVGGIHLIRMVDSWSIANILCVIKKIEEIDPDIVHIQYPTLGYSTGLLPYFLPLWCQFAGIATVQTWHEAPTRLRYLPNSLSKDAVIGVEPNYLDVMRSYYRVLLRRKNKVFIPISSNIPLARFSENERKTFRQNYAPKGRNLVCYFGFTYPSKGVDQLFAIADPEHDHLVLITKLDSNSDDYHRIIIQLSSSEKWRDRVTITGHQDANDVAKILSVADAVVFPFVGGVGMRNGSFLAARLQGSFTLTTSKDRLGYDEQENVFYAVPNDINAMRLALRKYIGIKRDNQISHDMSWDEVANAHLEIYKRLI